MVFIYISFEANERFFQAVENAKDMTIEGTTKGRLREIIWNDNEFRNNLKKFLDSVRNDFKPGDSALFLKNKYGARDVLFITSDCRIKVSAMAKAEGTFLNPHFQCVEVVKGNIDHHYFGIDPEVHCEKDLFGISFRSGDITVRVMFDLKKLEVFFNRERLTALLKNIAGYQSMKAVILSNADNGIIASYYENNGRDVSKFIQRQYYIQLNGLSLLKMTAYLHADPLYALKTQSKIVFSIIIFLFLSAYLLIERYGRLKSSMDNLKNDYSSLYEFSFKALSAFPFPALVLEGENEVIPINPAAGELIKYNINVTGDYKDAGYRVENNKPELLREMEFFKNNRTLLDFIESAKGFSQTELLIKTADSSVKPFRCQFVRAGNMALLLFLDAAEEKKREIQYGINSEYNMAALFLAKLAHELRNPLNAISMSLQIAGGIPCGCDYKNSAGANITFCLEEIERLNRIIKNYLMRRPREIELKEIDLNEVILYSVSIIKKYLSDSGYQDRIQIKAFTTEARVPINGSQDLLIQAFYNILINSAQAVIKLITESAEYRGEIIISETAGESCVTLKITDNGGGIAPEALDKIFDVGYSTKIEGSGLGLAITGEIIKQNGASIKISSEGANTVVDLTFLKSGG
jgi:signal transduction histidine kinase